MGEIATAPTTSGAHPATPGAAHPGAAHPGVPDPAIADLAIADPAIADPGFARVGFARLGVPGAGLPGGGLSRRRLLAALAFVPVGLAAGCAFGDQEPDPLLALVATARTDADLAAAALATHPGLAERVEPLRAARTEHADALDAEILRLDDGYDPTADGAARTAPQVPADADDALTALRDAAAAAGTAAGQVALGLPAERVGLVAAISACCGAYAEILATEAGT